jgi:hypothetical protein
VIDVRIFFSLLAARTADILLHFPTPVIADKKNEVYIHALVNEKVCSKNNLMLVSCIYFARKRNFIQQRVSSADSLKYFWSILVLLAANRSGYGEIELNLN